jgi:hypothetical protein
MAIKPKGIRREGAHILYGNILLATPHEDINLTVEPRELKRFVEKREVEYQEQKARRKR